MLNRESVESASTLLYESWREGGVVAALPEGLRPSSRSEGYAIQACIEGRSAAPLYGWKIAATSKAGQEHIGVAGPLAGRILAEQVIPDGASAPFGHNRMRVAEIEFAFRMGRDLAPRAEPYSVEEALAAVESLHPAIEIPDSRFEDFVTAGGPQLIADNACAHLFVLGPRADEAWRGLDLASHPGLGVIRGRYQREGVGANVLGDPRTALAWLVNELSGEGLTLKAGQVVTTGTCVKPLEIEPGDHILGDLGALGTVSVTLT